MRKILFLFGMLVIFALSASSQLRVTNNFGQDLNVENGGKTVFIPSKGMVVFPTRSRTVVLSCWTSDSKIKFVVSKEASRAGLVEINVSDGAGAVSQANPIIYTNASEPVSTPTYISENSQSLSAILSGTTTSEIYTPPTVNTSVSSVVTETSNVSFTNQTTQTIVTGEPITIEYSGNRTLKIISKEGQGLELFGSADSLNNPGAKNKYTIYVKKNADLVIGVGEKKRANQAIWPYGEIRKRINSNDAVCKITDSDVKMMSTNETRKLKFRVDAKGYKILIEPDLGDLISLAFQGISRAVELPVGQSYVRIAYTDPQGVFHPTAFMSVHVTSQDRYISITANDLAKTFTINNW